MHTSTRTYNSVRHGGLTSKNSVQKVRINYIYGFQGQESDDEVKGEGNSLNYEFRMHDPRIGRFFAIDPLTSKFPHNSPYAFSENKVIAWGELEGLECYYAADGTYLGQIGTSTAVRRVDSKFVETVKEHIDNYNKNCPPFNADGGANVYPETVVNMYKGPADALSTDVGMTRAELNLRATLSVIMSGEGGTDENRYKKKFGGGVLSNLKKHPGLFVWKTKVDKKTGKVVESKSSMAGAYQFKGTTYEEISKKIGLTDFSEESQDKAAISLLDTKGLLETAKSGDIQTIVDKLKSSTWTSLRKISDPESTFQQHVAKELSGQTLVATPQGQL